MNMDKYMNELGLDELEDVSGGMFISTLFIENEYAAHMKDLLPGRPDEHTDHRSRSASIAEFFNLDMVC